MVDRSKKPAPKVDVVAMIRDALADGDLSAEAAVELLVEHVVGEQLRGASARTRESVRAEVELLVAGDPTLAELLKP